MRVRIIASCFNTWYVTWRSHRRSTPVTVTTQSQQIRHSQSHFTVVLPFHQSWIRCEWRVTWQCSHDETTVCDETDIWGLTSIRLTLLNDTLHRMIVYSSSCWCLVDSVNHTPVSLTCVSPLRFVSPPHSIHSPCEIDHGCFDCSCSSLLSGHHWWYDSTHTKVWRSSEDHQETYR